MIRVTIFFLIVLSFACTRKKELTEQEIKVYQTELNEWYAKRVEDLKAPNGWINLVGLYWLEPGINSIGSGDNNQILFPKGTLPAKSGYLLVKDNTVSIFPEKDVNILKAGKAVVAGQVIFRADSARSAPVLEYGTLRWNIIQRDDKVGIRVRDLAHPGVAEFKGVDRFDTDLSCRVDALFEPADSNRTIDITNVLGQTTPQLSPGTLVFKLGTKEFRLDALKDNKEEYFVIFADATSGKQTYGGGRFLYVRKPGPDNKTVVDFNKAYNPPCVFTPYATCPLPPSQNILSAEVTAGEKNYGGGHSAAGGE